MITLEEGGDGAVSSPDQRGRCEVAVQWEHPEDLSREVGVQVDLIGLSFTKTGEDELPWRCVSVRAGEPGGGALWHCCLHAPSVASMLCPSANNTMTPTKTSTPEPDSTETTLPSMQHSSPNLNQSSLSLPSMPICGDSPSSPGPYMVTPPDPPLDSPVINPSPLGPPVLHHTPQDPMVSDNTLTAPPLDPPISDHTLLDPLVLDNTPPAPLLDPPVPDHTSLDPSDHTPEAELEALGFMAPLSSDEEDAAPAEHDGSFTAVEPPIKPRRRRCRNQTPPTAHVRRRNINARQAGLPLRYQQDYDLSAKHEPQTQVKQEEEEKTLGEFQKIARRQLEALQREEPDLQIDPSLFSQPFSPNKKQCLVPVKMKKTSNKVCYWAVETTEDKMDERSDLVRDRWSTDSIGGTRSDEVIQGSGKTNDSLNNEKIINKQEDNGILLEQSQNQHQTPSDLSSVQTEPRKSVVPMKRKPGRPKKIKVKEENIEIGPVTGADVTVKSNTKRPVSVERSDRPRREIRVRPKRYLEFDSMDDWNAEVMVEESYNADRYGRVTNGGVSIEKGESGRCKLTLGDMHGGSKEEGGLVKKVQILSEMDNAESKRRKNGSQMDLEDIQDLFVLRGSEDDSWEQRNGDGDREWKREDRGEQTRKPKHKGSKRLTGFMVYRDEETGRTTFISPCFVKLQPLEKQEQRSDLENMDTNIDMSTVNIIQV